MGNLEVTAAPTDFKDKVKKSAIDFADGKIKIDDIPENILFYKGFAQMCYDAEFERFIRNCKNTSF